MKPPALLLGLTCWALLASCQNPKTPFPKNIEGVEAANMHMAAKLEEYWDRNRMYEISKLPAFTTAAERTQLPFKNPLLKGRGWTLKFNIGHRREDARGFRTESRYHLTDKDGSLQAAAESVFAREDLASDSDLRPLLQIFTDATNNSILIHEEHNWSTKRVILFVRKNTTGIFQDSWEVRYLNINFVPTGKPFSEYTILGIVGGKLYIRQHGHIHAFPFRSIPSYADLAYTIG